MRTLSKEAYRENRSIASAGATAYMILRAGVGHQWDSIRSLVRGSDEEHDLEGLAPRADIGLLALRQLCERPLTREELDELLDGRAAAEAYAQPRIGKPSSWG